MIIKYNNIEFKQTEFDSYFVSRCGEIISTKVKGGQGRTDMSKPRVHSKKIDKDGYFEVCISIVDNGVHIRKYRRLHRLVYQTWIGDIVDTIDHIDGNRQNNNIENLRDVSRSENVKKSQRRSRVYNVFYSDGSSRLIKVETFKELSEAIGISESSIRARMNNLVKNVKLDIVRVTECND